MSKQTIILPDEWVAKISRLSIATSSKLRGQHKGGNRSQRFGSSLDFSDFREYTLGDDVRQVDWNVYARTEKYFIKRFLDEQEMRVHVLLDATRSMGEEKKWRFARQIASAIGLMVLNRDDRLSFSYVGETQALPFRRKGATYRKHFLQIVSSLEEASGKGSFAREGIKALPKDSTVLFIITDGLEPIAEWQQFFKRLPRFAGDIRCIQIVTENELRPSYTGDVRLIDAETNRDVNVSVSNRVLAGYEKTKEMHEAEFDALANRFGIRKIQLVVEDGLQNAIFHKLLKSHWVQ
ncbi:DUF58 domain-containing protein [Ureibacillus chungkukjangi]|uniref:Uncharacterized protein DUF58 n=1 Tax=Ureibacillus chungkukjangi TaxID=1202712 RepID=A0A318TCG4_9BACL|nr:DUF58 domain-containing protein [Ureibacillus chungkukjangi]MCM3390512.1 DUF58 domain-containing protein [Ureibacillus chungkukjangi]PYF02316.1 uncharacterized protein DUF58 [Ureibacillus chungkukjangi]HCG4536171.1 DUF58 domain-containing protein [Salmonella enterica subsp. enterica serovar Typhi str. AG3]